MCIKWLASIFVASLVYSCSPFNNGGELRVRSQKRWFEPVPYGMVEIPTGSLNIGNNDEDITWAMSASTRTISVQAFWMDETEITNNQYRRFVAWVVDSIKRQRLADADMEEFLLHNKKEVVEPRQLDYRTSFDIRRNKEAYEEAWSGLYYTGDDQVEGKGTELDVRKLEYVYTWYDFAQAARNDRYYDPETQTYKGGFVIDVNGEKKSIKGRTSFIMKKKVKVYPDTLCWLKDYTYAYNEPFVREYFSHPGYGEYPVVGINWHQAQSFCNWRTRYYNMNNSIRVQEWRLPNEAEWEYASRGGLSGAKYPWGGPYTRNGKGCFLANFKPLRGNYISDGGFTTVPVRQYTPNGYGLYDMAGNVAEWTGDSYDESAYQVTHDLSPYYQSIPKKTDNKIFKRKVVRGGSWKDIAYYLQCGVRTYEYADSTRCFIGFRTVRTKIEFKL